MICIKQFDMLPQAPFPGMEEHLPFKKWFDEEETEILYAYYRGPIDEAADGFAPKYGTLLKYLEENLAKAKMMI